MRSASSRSDGVKSLISSIGWCWGTFEVEDELLAASGELRAEPDEPPGAEGGAVVEPVADWWR